jgi:hypothetical protein
MRVIFDRSFTLIEPFVAIHKFQQERLDLLQGEIEPDATSWADSERAVGCFVARLLAVPAIWVESVWVIPDCSIVVDVMNYRNHNGPGCHLVASREDTIFASYTTRLVRRIMVPLHLLDIACQERKVLHEVRGDLCILVDIVVDELLQKASLHSFVGAKTVY